MKTKRSEQTSSCSFAKFSNLDFKLPAAPEPAVRTQVDNKYWILELSILRRLLSHYKDTKHHFTTILPLK